MISWRPKMSNVTDKNTTIENIPKENNSFSTGFLRFCNTTVTVIMIVLIGYLFLLSIFSTCMINSYAGFEKVVYLTDSPLFHISAIIMILLIGYLAASRMHTFSKKMMIRLLIILHIAVTIVIFIAILIYDYAPIWDQDLVLNSSYNLINADYSNWQFAGHNYLHPWMNSLTLLFVPPVYLFGMHGSIIAIRIFNLAMFLLASLSLYGFCKETKLRSVITSSIFILYLPVGLYIFFVYGNMASLSLSLFAIWMVVRYLNHKHIKDALFCAITISLAALFKDHALIAFIAIMIVMGICSITSRCWKQLLWLPVFVMIYMGCSLTVDTVIETVTGEEIPSAMDIYGHLLMGISEGERANGWYNSMDSELMEQYNYDYDTYNTEVKAAYLQRLDIFLNDPAYAADFLIKKNASQWINPTFEATWNIQYMYYYGMLGRVGYTPCFLFIDGFPANMLFYYIFNLIQSIVLFGCLCFFIFESKNASLATLLPAITFIGGFIFLFFWEAKAQYTLLFFIMLFPYSAAGLISILQKLITLTASGSKKLWYRSKEVVFLGVLLGIILLLAVTNVKPINNAFKLGTDDEFYDECMEQNVLYYSRLLEILK